MRIVILYRPKTEGESKVMDYAHEYQMRHRDRKLETLSVDTPEGDDLARIHGITNFPAVLAMGDDGRFLQLWQDEHLPLMNELDFYLAS